MKFFLERLLDTRRPPGIFLDDFIDCRNGMFVVANGRWLRGSDRYSPDDVPDTSQSLMEHLLYPMRKKIL